MIFIEEYGNYQYPQQPMMNNPYQQAYGYPPNSTVIINAGPQPLPGSYNNYGSDQFALGNIFLFFLKKFLI